ncbi:hypothetical protein Godav_017648 [Gossypium davidsonii]|uniref:Uncharacterized protein n=1 Tax=Gossypium davidsonii TaxID=34287 RepID=A0A7J8QV69_GOSDV|nr:hypothetical protein [Gossypium davidsonii]
MLDRKWVPVWSPMMLMRSYKVQMSSPLISVAPGSCSRTLPAEGVPNDAIDGEILHVEDESLAYHSTLTLKGCDREEVVVDVGSLDSGEHSAEIFPGNKNANNKNNALSIKKLFRFDSDGALRFGKEEQN